MWFRFTLAIAVTFWSQASLAQSLRDAKQVFSSGNWHIYRSVDSMTDKATCTGIYKDDFSIQLGSEQLAIRVAGGIDSVTLRYGELPARSMRLPSQIEKKIRALILEDGEFLELLNVERLRYQVLTLVRGVASADLDLVGLRAAVESIRAGCPASTSPAQATSPVEPVGVLCSSQLVARMRQRGMDGATIADICR